MANIRIDLGAVVVNGQALTFRAPADCSAITGLIIYYPEGDTTTSKTFKFVDAHGVDVGSGTFSLFAADALVKVVLDIDQGKAYVQNADTNAYIEKTFVKSVNGKKPDDSGNVYLGLWSSFGPTLNSSNCSVDSGSNTITYDSSTAGKMGVLLSACGELPGLFRMWMMLGGMTVKAPCTYVTGNATTPQSIIVTIADVESPTVLQFTRTECRSNNRVAADIIASGGSISFSVTQMQ